MSSSNDTNDVKEEQITVTYDGTKFSSNRFNNTKYKGFEIYTVITPQNNSFKLIPENDPLPELDLNNPKQFKNSKFAGYYCGIIPIFTYKEDNKYYAYFADLVTGNRINVILRENENVSDVNPNLKCRLNLALERLKEKIEKYDKSCSHDDKIRNLLGSLNGIFGRFLPSVNNEPEASEAEEESNAA